VTNYNQLSVIETEGPQKKRRRRPEEKNFVLVLFTGQNSQKKKKKKKKKLQTKPDIDEQDTTFSKQWEDRTNSRNRRLNY
jgi:hypothetical protein